MWLWFDLSLQFQYLLVWPVPSAQVLPRPQLIFPSKTWFFGIYSVKSCSLRSFQQHQRPIPIPPKFWAIWFNLIFSEEIIQYLRTFAPQVQTSWNQRHQEQDLKHPNSVDLITTKQNKLPSFIDRLFLAYPHLQRLALEINVLSKEEKIF